MGPGLTKDWRVDIKIMVVPLSSPWAKVEVKSSGAEGRISFPTAYTMCEKWILIRKRSISRQLDFCCCFFFICILSACKG